MQEPEKDEDLGGGDIMEGREDVLLNDGPAVEEDGAVTGLDEIADEPGEGSEGSGNGEEPSE